MEIRPQPQWYSVRIPFTLIMDWLKNNAWSLAIAVVTLISTFTLFGYRIDALEKRADATDQQIATLTSGNVTTQIALAQIQTKLEYITVQLDKITP